MPRPHPFRVGEMNFRSGAYFRALPHHRDPPRAAAFGLDYTETRLQPWFGIGFALMRRRMRNYAHRSRVAVRFRPAYTVERTGVQCAAACAFLRRHMGRRRDESRFFGCTGGDIQRSDGGACGAAAPAWCCEASPSTDLSANTAPLGCQSMFHVKQGRVVGFLVRLTGYVCPTQSPGAKHRATSLLQMRPTRSHLRIRRQQTRGSNESSRDKRREPPLGTACVLPPAWAGPQAQVPSGYARTVTTAVRVCRTV
ncbi:UNVERIFIED_ORG: hypothetical protein J2X79_001474 [Arthrobacter globiformis]|nr:hypothetical protein [Arthrobacter globiformis]